MSAQQKFAVLGYPLKHSLSPKIFNFLAKYFDLNFSYEILEIEPQEFSTSLDKIKEFDGINITSPYKEKILSLSKKKSSEVDILKASNVLKKVSEDKFESHNTDVFGFKESLKEYEVESGTALVLGSSGAARAVILGLYQMGITDIYVKARNYDSLKNFDIAIKKYTNQKPDYIFQATTIGLNKKLEQLTDDEVEFLSVDYSQCKIAYDLIYSPKVTPFMQISKGNNVSEILNGENMLILQALRTFDIWFGPQAKKSSNIVETIKEVVL